MSSSSIEHILFSLEGCPANKVISSALWGEFGQGEGTVARESWDIIWGQALEAEPKLPPPAHWGWTKNSDNNWDIYWTDLSPISDICKELCKCSCKKQCSARCSCRKSNLQCTSICNCPCVIGE